MPARKSHRMLVWVAFFIVWGILVGQFSYSFDRAVPLARIGNDTVGFASHDDMARQLTEKFNKTNVKLRVDGTSVVYPLSAAGAELNTEKLISELTNYPFWQRFIPLSIVWQSPKIEYADVYYTDAVLRQFSDARSKELSFAPTNARLAIRENTLVATPEKAGSTTTPESVYKALSEAQVSLGGTSDVAIKSKQIAAERSMSEFGEVKTRAEQALDRSVTIKAGDMMFNPSREEVASWILLDTDQAGSPSLRIDQSKVAAYITTVNDKVGVPAGQTDIQIVNGRETSRVTGKIGRAVNSDLLADQLSQYVLHGKGSSVSVAIFVDVQPSVIYNSKYTATQEGLQAYVTDQSRTKNVRISIKQLDGAGWSANARADESTVSASTYKLFVSLKLFDDMNRGMVSWNDPMLDTTVSTCFDRMTIASTNPCAEKWLAEWGRPSVNTFIYDNGFSRGTTFTNNIATHTTANDLTKFMIGLHDGSLVPEPYRSRLIHSLSVHPYRYGIPTGSKGKVYDKVGFLWDYVNDAAIVKHPQGTYAMSIMTKGQSYAAIANMTREIERIMYP